MSSTKPTQLGQKSTANSLQPTVIPSLGLKGTAQTAVQPASTLPTRMQNTVGGLLTVPKRSHFDKLVLADAVKFDKGDLYIMVHRAVKPGVSEETRFSLYSCGKHQDRGMRWAVKGTKPFISALHAPMAPQDVLDLRGTSTFKLCFAVVIKQDIDSQAKQSLSSPSLPGKNIPKSDWESVLQIITQDEEKGTRFLPVDDSLDYVKVTVRRLEKAGLVRFRDELRFWEEIESAEEMFAYGNVGPLPDRILMSRNVLYC